MEILPILTACFNWKTVGPNATDRNASDHGFAIYLKVEVAEYPFGHSCRPMRVVCFM